jgi:hypothetical protein
MVNELVNELDSGLKINQKKTKYNIPVCFYILKIFLKKLNFFILSNCIFKK